MKRSLFILTIIIILFSISNAQKAENQSVADKVLLRGRITTLNKTPFPRAIISIEKIAPRKPEYFVDVYTDKYGDYALRVPKGVYEVKVKGWVGKLTSAENETTCAPKCEWYFEEVSRANIDLTKLSSQNLNFALVKEGYFVSSYRKPLVELKYEVISAFVSKNLSLNMMIRYTVKDENGQLTTYKSNESFTKKSIYPLTTLTYDNITIYSDSFVYDKEKRQISTVGKVIVDDGLNEFEANKAIIGITNSKPFFQFVK